MVSTERVSDRDSFTFVRRNDHGILSKLRQPAERGGTVLHELRRAHCRSSAQSRAACRRCARTAQSRAADAARGSAPPPPQYAAPTPPPPSQHPSVEASARSGGIAAGVAAAVGGVLGGMGGQPPAMQPYPTQNPQMQQPPAQAEPYHAPAPPLQQKYQAGPQQTGAYGAAAGAPETPAEKIKEMFFTCRGRLNRKPFFLRGLALGILSSILSSVMGEMSDSSSTALHIAALLMLPLILICCVASIMLVIRRWHDLGKSGWFTLVLIIPLVNLLVMLYLWFVRGTAGPNAYGDDPLA